MEPYHPLYLNTQFKAQDFSEIANYFSSIDRKIVYDHPAVLARKEELVTEGLSIRSIRLDDYENELISLTY